MDIGQVDSLLVRLDNFHFPQLVDNSDKFHSLRLVDSLLVDTEFEVDLGIRLDQVLAKVRDKDQAVVGAEVEAKDLVWLVGHCNRMLAGMIELDSYNEVAGSGVLGRMSLGDYKHSQLDIVVFDYLCCYT